MYISFSSEKVGGTEGFRNTEPFCSRSPQLSCTHHSVLMGLNSSSLLDLKKNEKEISGNKNKNLQSDF